MKKNMILAPIVIIVLVFLAIKWVVPYFQHRPVKPSYQPGTTTSAKYGQPVEFGKFEKITYPDFVVSYKGITYKKDVQFMAYFSYYNFDVLKTLPEQSDPLLTTISWTAGTGLNMPYVFSVQNHNYELLMRGDNIIINNTITDPISLMQSQSSQTQTTGQYGKKVKYNLNSKIAFPDFDLEYKGTSTIPGPNGAEWSMTTYNFVISKNNESQNIGWSSGTGDIGPAAFTFKNKKYWIEKLYTSKDEKLAPDEIVITAK
jgi:hypothetical protein